MLLAAYEDQSRKCIPRASNPALAQSRSRSRPHRRGGSRATIYRHTVGESA